jgi:putative DNA primase/helicase
VVDCYCDEADRQSKLATEAARNGKKEQQDGHLKKQKELLLRVLQLQTKHRKEDVLFLAAQGADGLGIRGDEWDADPMLLGCTNGVVDLQDGSFRDGHPGDFIKTTSPTEWRGINTPCPTFKKFISEVIVDDKLNPDPKTTAYLQRLMGYGTTGKISEHVLPVLVGEEGRGGKGTFLEELAFTLGPLARKVPSELLLAKSRSRDSSAASPDLMDLRGRRLCWCNETNEGRKLDLSLAKELAGGDTISARQLHGKIVNFIPTHLLILSTNYAPKIPSKTNDPIWDRITTIPFRLKFVDDPIAEHERKRDRELLSSLKLEAPGVLAWLVRGALAWQSEGLNPPDNVRAATKAYQKSEDTVGRFLEDCVEENKTGMEQAGPLFAAYELWCEDAPAVSVGKTAFGIYLTKRYDKTKGKTKFYLGIKLK